MNRRKFITHSGLLSAISFLTPRLLAKPKTMKIHFLRHATFILEAGDIKILVDPMLSPKNAMDPVKITRNSYRIPMVDLPVSEEELKKELSGIDAVIVTHTHRDHWDERARQLLDKKIPLICQPADVETIQGQGFGNLLPVETIIDFKDLRISRTGGQHGTGEIGLKMGHVSGFVIEYKNEKIYIAGDTIWCSEVEQALTIHKPTYSILNAGAAQFDQGDPITMTADDVIRVCQVSPSTTVIAVHMDTVNHCALTRNDLQKALEANKLQKRVIIPKDGQWINL